MQICHQKCKYEQKRHKIWWTKSGNCTPLRGPPRYKKIPDMLEKKNVRWDFVTLVFFPRHVHWTDLGLPIPLAAPNHRIPEYSSKVEVKKVCVSVTSSKPTNAFWVVNQTFKIKGACAALVKNSRRVGSAQVQNSSHKFKTKTKRIIAFAVTMFPTASNCQRKQTSAAQV